VNAGTSFSLDHRSTKEPAIMTSLTAYYAFIVTEHERRIAARRAASASRQSPLSRLGAFVAGLRHQRKAARPA
jgi:hypothetical protein